MVIVKVEPLMVAGSIASEKVTSVLAVVATPVAPSVGTTLLTEGATVSTVSTVQVRLAGVASVLPAPSLARTSKVWEPLDRLV